MGDGDAPQNGKSKKSPEQKSPPDAKGDHPVGQHNQLELAHKLVRETYGTPTTNMATAALAQWAEFVARTEPQLEQAFGEPVPMTLGGSLRTGTFRGPKPSRESGSAGLPVVELDGRIHLPNGINPRDPATIAKLQAITGLTEGLKLQTKPIWGNNPMNIANLYGRRPFGSNILEIECGAVERRAGMLESDIAAFWQRIFSPREVTWTADTRQAMRDANIGYETPGGVRDLKNFQAGTAHARLLAGWAVGIIPELPSPGTEPAALLKDWWREPPPSYNPKAFAMDLPDKPEAPAWVSRAEQLANRMRQRRFASLSGSTATAENDAIPLGNGTHQSVSDSELKIARRLLNEPGFDPALLWQRLSPQMRYAFIRAANNGEAAPSLPVLALETNGHTNGSSTTMRSENSGHDAVTAPKPPIKPDEVIPVEGRDTLRERYNQELEAARSRADKTTPARPDAPETATNQLSGRLKTTATNPLVLLKLGQACAHAATGDLSKAKFHLEEAAAIGGTNLVVSTATDTAKYAALAKLGNALGNEAALTAAQRTALATTKHLGSLVGEGFVVYSALNKETGSGTAAELTTGTTETAATTALFAMLLKQGLAKSAGPIAAVIATGDLIRFGGNVLATMNGTERPAPSMIQQTAQAVWDFHASQFINKAQALNVDALVNDLHEGAPPTPRAAEMYKRDYPERLVTDTDLEPAYRAFGRAKIDSAAFMRSLFSAYDDEHSNLKEYFDRLARYEDAAELHIAGAKQYQSVVPGLHIPADIARPPLIDAEKYPQLAALEKQWQQAAPGMTFRERYDHIRQSTLSTNNPYHMIDLPKDRQALQKELAAFTMEKYIPYQAALIENHAVFVQNEKTVETFQQQIQQRSRQELQQQSWELAQNACNELRMLDDPGYKAVANLYSQKPTQENLQQVIAYLMQAAQR